MTTFEAAMLHGLKVAGHIFLSIAFTALLAYLAKNVNLLYYVPVVNVVEAAVFKFLFPDNPTPDNLSIPPTVPPSTLPPNQQ